MKKLAQLRVQAILENVPRAMSCARAAAQQTGFGQSAIYQIELVVDEACANVIQHAYAGTEPGDMEVACYLDGRRFLIQVRDWGRSFDPRTVPEPDVEAPLEERSLGGLGLFLIREFMDEVDFSFDPDKGNVLTMVKRLPDGQ